MFTSAVRSHGSAADTFIFERRALERVEIRPQHFRRARDERLRAGGKADGGGDCENEIIMLP